MKPIVIELFCGLGGWTEGFLAEGWQAYGFDIERHAYGDSGYPAQLILQDVLTIVGSQFRNVHAIVASPPCQKYSYMAMPFSRGKNLAAWLREDAQRQVELNALFDACFRIQREACDAAGRYIPMVVENVKGAQPWVGRAKWHYGSFYLWGDVPALMPMIHGHRKVEHHCDGFVPVGVGQSTWFHGNTKHELRSGVKQPGLLGDEWFNKGLAKFGSRSSARKAASAQIAKIPLPLARYIAKTFFPSPNIETHSLKTTSEQQCKTFTKDCGNFTDEQEAKGR